MALLTVTSLVRTGTLVSLAAVNTTDTVVADDETWLHVKNASGGAITVTLSDGTTSAIGNAPTLVANSVAAGAERLFPLYQKQNDSTTGVTTITYSSATSVTAAAFRA